MSPGWAAALSTTFVTISCGVAVTSVFAGLLVASGVSAEMTVALFVTTVVPAGNTASRRTTRVTVRTSPAGSVPRPHVAVPPRTTPPSLALTNVAREGSASLITTADAAASPPLDSVSAYVSRSPGEATARSTDFVRVKTGAASTVVAT